ncbi:hypothetical protein J3B02_005107, partial [Coemansia erecta]
MFMHHSSCSVDLGSLSSAFNVAQFNQTLSGQISPIAINPASMIFNGHSSGDIHPMHYAAFNHNPQLMALSHAPTLAGSGATTDAVSADDFEDDDVDEDDEEADNSTDEKPAGSSSASVSNKSQSTKANANSNANAGKTGTASGSSTPKPKKASAPYKRFRNSFIFFANERRKQWRREHPEVSKIQNRGFIQDMSKVWNNMAAEEKEPYIKMAEEDKARYEEDVKKFGPLQSNAGSSSVAAAASVSASASALGASELSTPADAAAFKSKGKAASSVGNSGAPNGLENSAASIKKLPNVVPIAPAPAPAQIAPAPAQVAPMVSASVPASVSLSVPLSASAPVDAVTCTAQFLVSSAAVSISNAAPVSIATTTTTDGSASIAAAASAVTDTSSVIAQPTPTNPAVIGSNVAVPMMPTTTTLDSMDLDNVILAQHTYQVWLQQALGQDFSPQAIEFDPSCFVASDPTSADESSCYASNAQSLTASMDIVPQQLSAAPSDSLASASEPNSSKAQITSSATASSSN